MATKMVFFPSSKQLYENQLINFVYTNGYSTQTKFKNINPLHLALTESSDKLKPLEVSSHSNSSLGVSLSAFNLKYNFSKGLFPIESIYQSSKVFEDNSQYEHILSWSPLDAKKFIRTINKRIISFKLENKSYPIIPSTVFYDWIYLRAIKQNLNLMNFLLDFNAFTDIEFNHEKSINCQARSCAIFVSLVSQNKIKKIDDFNDFVTLYDEISLF